MLLFTSSFLCLSLCLTFTTTTSRRLLLSHTTGLLIPVLLCSVVIALTLLALHSKLQGLRDPQDADFVNHAPLLLLDDLGPDCGQLESREIDGGENGAA